MKLNLKENGLKYTKKTIAVVLCIAVVVVLCIAASISNRGDDKPAAIEEAVEDTAAEVPATDPAPAAQAGASAEPSSAEPAAAQDAAPTTVSLDFQALMDNGTYTIAPAAQSYLTAACYEISGVVYCTNVLSEEYQYMNIWIPAAYVNADGSFNTEASVNGWTVSTAPIIFRNNCAGWFSGSPESDDENSIGLNDYMENGFIYVACGARSRDADNGGEGDDYYSVGKAPAPIVDLKAGIRYLRLNDAAIPGDAEHIISIGGSGAGEMSTLVGATGNMAAYYPYLYEIGAAGIEYDAASGTYASTIADDVFGCMAYYPITDIDNADLAYAWMRVNSGETGVHTNDPFPTDADFTPFQLALQEDEAEAFVTYINSLGLVDENGNALTLDGIRSGSYYDAILGNMSDALNAYLAELAPADAAAYIGLLMATNTPEETWIVQNTDGAYAVIDLDGFIRNFGNYGRTDELGTVFARNKNIPGFDTLALDAENNAFGYADQSAVHYSRTVAQVLADHYGSYLGLMTDEERAQADLWIAQALTGDEADFLVEQTYLMDAMEIMQAAAAGQEETTIAPYWRIRSGTADQHTSFTIGYNTALAAQENGIDCDYSLVWAMIHGGEIEGTSTGTFVDWVNEITAAPAAAEASASPSGEASL